MAKLNSQQWSNYWQKGTITTFHRKFENNYDSEIKSHWYKIFKQLKNGSSVVDLATGNGALLYLLDEYAVENECSYNAIGVDFAEINQDIFTLFKLCDVELKAHTMIENTGLPENSINCAISQYGFEYANLAETVLELNKILKSKASLSFIMHTHDSQIIKEGFESLKQIELISGKLKVNKTIEKILPAIEKLKQTGKIKYKLKADKLRDKLNKSMGQVMNFAQTIGDPSYIEYYYKNALSVFKGVIAKKYSLQQKLRIIKSIDKETSNLKQRMEDLTSVAMTEQRNTELIRLLTKAHFKNIVIKPFHYNSINIGQVLTAQRD